MTEAFAIKGPDGIDARYIRKWERECWKAMVGNHEEGEFQKRVTSLQQRSYRCVPVTVSENTTPVCPNCNSKEWADFYRGSSVIASVCKRCDYKITPPVSAVSEKGEADKLLLTDTGDYYIIPVGTSAYMQRKQVLNATDSPLRDDEKVIIHLCAHLSRKEPK